MPEPRTTREGGYPWEQYATGGWVRLRHMPVTMQHHGTIDDFLRKGERISSIRKALTVSGRRWAAVRGRTFQMRTDARASQVWVKIGRAS